MQTAVVKMPLIFRIGLLALVTGSGVPAPGAELRVMSLNALQDANAANAGNANAWNYTGGEPRRERAVRVITECAPDILGIQEIEPNQVSDLTHTNALAAYGFYGAGRDDGASAGTHEGIFYLTNRFTRTAQGVFWLSTTPDTPGSKYAGAAQVRIAVWARLSDARTGRTLLVVSTHWDYQSAAPREYSAGLIRSRLLASATGQEVIVTADLNGTEDERAYGILLGREDPAGVQLTDSYRACVPVRQAGELTRHDFTGNTAGSRLDFIFVSAAFTTTNAAIVRTAYGGRYPSDHYPVTAWAALCPAAPVITGLRPEAEASRLTWSAVAGCRYGVDSSASLRPWSNLFGAPLVVTAAGAVAAISVPTVPTDRAQFFRVACSE